ncbi:hypothetical protein TWF569_000239 [Orbilia oligospora]|nr:hypothetical protein TWF569_000239 [Orbilia oligospora]
MNWLTSYQTFFMAAAQSQASNGVPAAGAAPHRSNIPLTDGPPSTGGSLFTGNLPLTSDPSSMGDSSSAAPTPGPPKAPVTPPPYGTCASCGGDQNEFVSSALGLSREMCFLHQQQKAEFKSRISFWEDKYNDASKSWQDERKYCTLKMAKMQKECEEDIAQVLNLLESEEKQNGLLLKDLNMYKKYLDVEAVSLIEENRRLEKKVLEYEAVKKERDALKESASYKSVIKQGELLEQEKVRYDRIQVKYDGLQVKYDLLRLKYDELEVKDKDLVAKYNDLRENATSALVFMGLVTIFCALLLYLKYF